MKYSKKEKGGAMHTPSVSIKDATAGVTLVALIITVIILLILIAVAVGITIGENGILSTTKEAEESYVYAEFLEQVYRDAFGCKVQLDDEYKYTATVISDDFRAKMENRGYETEVDGEQLKVRKENKEAYISDSLEIKAEKDSR